MANNTSGILIVTGAVITATKRRSISGYSGPVSLKEKINSETGNAHNVSIVIDVITSHVAINFSREAIQANDQSHG